MSDWRDPDLDHLERHLEHELVSRGMTRAQLVAGGGKLAGALGIGWLYQMGASLPSTDSQHTSGCWGLNCQDPTTQLNPGAGIERSESHH